MNPITLFAIILGSGIGLITLGVLVRRWLGL